MVAEYCCTVWFGSVFHCCKISFCRKSPVRFCIAFMISFFTVSVVVVFVLMSVCFVMCVVLVGMAIVCSVFLRACWNNGTPCTVFDE